MLNYYGARAAGGAGMLVTEPLSVLPWQTQAHRVNVFTDRGYSGLCQLAEFVESKDCRLVAQIQDRGRGRHERGRNPFTIGPSALPDDLSWIVPHAMSLSEVERLIEQLIEAAARLRQAGFSGVEFSAGHGHLFHQFLSRRSNHRTDRYGGSFENRVRLLKELTSGVRNSCGSNFIIGLKLPGDDGVAGSVDVGEAARITGALADEAVVSYFCFVRGSHAASLHEHIPDLFGPRAPFIEMTRLLRKSSGKVPVMAIGLITDPVEADALLATGAGELIGLGRALIADPALPRKAAEGREADIRYCVSCNSCWGAIVEEQSPVACDNNPRVSMRNEADWWPERESAGKNIVIVGAGVAGMETAWVAAARGHDVTVFGAGPELGGKARLRAKLPGGEHISSVYDYQALAAKRAGVHIELDVSATLSDITQLNPDAVVLATGSQMSWPEQLPRWLQSEGIILDLRNLMADLVNHGRREDGTVVIFDQDHTSGTYAAALRLREMFERVLIVTPRDRIAQDEPLVTRQVLYRHLAEKGVEIQLFGEPHLESRWEDGVVSIRNVLTGDFRNIDDLAIFTYATPRLPSVELWGPLTEQGVSVHLIGDAFAPRTLMSATSEGHKLGCEL